MLPATKALSFNFPGLQIASVEDPTRSTGATLFFFPEGATAQVDIRGGSAATSETELLSEGSYSNFVNGIAFAGGSTMGLAVGDGVREVIFRDRSKDSAPFDSIPSVPTAVVYDFGGRFETGKDKLIYPDRAMGLRLMKSLSSSSFVAGRAGAGVTTTANKSTQKIWGGQGLAQRNLGYGKVLAAVVMNPMGDVSLAGGSVRPIPQAPEDKPKTGTNTTLSIVVTDVKLTRVQLKRLAVMVHTSMARSIFPFHSFYDGDSHFAVSTQATDFPASEKGDDAFMALSIAASEAMQEAIEIAVLTANANN